MNRPTKYFQNGRLSKFADLPIMVGSVTKFVMPTINPYNLSLNSLAIISAMFWISLTTYLFQR